MMCSSIPLTLVSLRDENFIIRVLANALSEVSNYSSMDFSIALTSLCWSMDSSRYLGLNKHDTEVIRSLQEFMKNQFSWSTDISNFWFIFPNGIVNVHTFSPSIIYSYHHLVREYHISYQKYSHVEKLHK